MAGRLLLAVTAALLAAGPVAGEVTLVGSLIPISASGAFWPAVEYNPSSQLYLALWVDVTDVNGWQLKGHLVNADTGNVVGTAFYVSSGPTSVVAVIGAITYNSVNHEWFIAYQGSINGGEDDVLGQRIAANGSPVGGYLPLVVKAGYQNAADVAHDPINNRYLVVWREKVGNDGQVFSRIFNADGSPATAQLRLSEVDDRGKYSPRVVFNPVANEFMVAWQDYRNWPGSGQDNDYSDVYGQRVNVSTGAKIGANIAIYSPTGSPYVPDGQDVPNGIACNTLDGRYAIGVTKLTAAQGYTTVGLVIDSTGSKVAPVFNLSRPNFGAQATPAYNPISNTFFISYEGPSSNVAGKEISANGVPLTGEQTIISTLGSIRDNVLAVRPENGQYFQAAISDSGVYQGQRFAACVGSGVPSAVGDFAVNRAPRQNNLTWRNPPECTFRGTLIRYRTDAYPTSPTDGLLVIDKPGGPGTLDSYAHSNLIPGTSYYYSAFAYDSVPQYAGPAQVAAVALSVADLDLDNDVDQTDFGLLQACLSGTGVLAPGGCESADLTGDLAVDDQDAQLFMTCVAGANQTPGC
jgi:hypothetical protein